MKRFFLITSLFFLLSASSAHAGITQPPTTRGLVGYWSMEDCKLTKATDNSGRGNTGTLTNFALTGATSNWVAGKLGACALNFDGTTDYVSSSQVLTSGVFTMSAWINPARYGASNQANGIIYQGTGVGDGGMALAVYANNSGLLLRSGTTSYLSNSNVITLNRWQHVAVTVSGSSYAFYVDGVIVGQGSGTVALSANSLKLGYWYNAAESFRFFQGSMDDVRVYNRALTGNEIARLYGGGSSRAKPATTRGLVGHWSFEDCKLNKASDDSGRGNTGTLTNFALTGATSNWVAGKLGACALNFDGINDQILTSSTTDFTFGTGDFTIAFWMKSLDSVGAEIIAQFGSGAGNWGIVMYLSDLYLQSHFGTTNVYSRPATAILDNKWHHVVVMRSGSSNRMLFDGVQQGATVADSTNFVSVNQLSMGGRSAYYFAGSLDDIRVYNRALTGNEISDLYNSSATRYNASTAALQAGTSLASGLVGHWTFDGANLTSTKAKDSTANLNHGTLTGANGLPRPIMGQLGQALSFDGVDDYVISSNVVNTSPVTVSAWVKLTSYPAAKGLVAGFVNGIGAATYDKDLYINTDGRLYFYVYDGAQKTTSAPASPIPLNTWVHVMGVANGSTAKTYVDGVEVGSVVAGATYTGYTVPNILIEGTSNLVSISGGYMAATIDDVRVYNRALSAAEITQLYNLGR